MAKNFNIPESSFVNMFPEIIYDKDQVGEVSLDIWNNFRIDILPRELDRKAFFRYRVTDQDTLESLAQTYYGDVRLWWLTLVINDVEDPFDFIENNMLDRITTEDGIIKILKQEHVESIQFQIKALREFLTRRNQRARTNKEDVKQV